MPRTPTTSNDTSTSDCWTLFILLSSSFTLDIPELPTREPDGRLSSWTRKGYRRIHGDRQWKWAYRWEWKCLFRLSSLWSCCKSTSVHLHDDTRKPAADSLVDRVEQVRSALGLMFRSGRINASRSRKISSCQSPSGD